MLGCGHSPLVSIISPGETRDANREWVTLDMNEDCNPDHLFNLERIDSGKDLPCSGFDEIHAYEVMEHFGRQGNFKGLFNAFNAIWRALVPGGVFFASSPRWSSEWAWGDPGHTRIVGLEQITYVCKGSYDQLSDTPMTDYRRFVDPHWWELEWSTTDEHRYYYILRRLDD